MSEVDLVHRRRHAGLDAESGSKPRGAGAATTPLRHVEDALVEQAPRALISGVKSALEQAGAVNAFLSARAPTADDALADRQAARVGRVGRVADTVASAATKLSAVASDAAAPTFRPPVERLPHRAAQLDDATRLLADIGEQTNVLALSAIVAAARADAAAGGLAAVASNATSLAVHASAATEDIATQIRDAHAITQQSVQALGAAGTAQEAAAGDRDVARHVAAPPKGSEAAAAASDELARQAEFLREEVEMFLRSIRAA